MALSAFPAASASASAGAGSGAGASQYTQNLAEVVGASLEFEEEGLSWSFSRREVQDMALRRALLASGSGAGSMVTVVVVVVVVLPPVHTPCPPRP